MDDLYRDYILEHYRRPHNFGVLDEPSATFEGANPLCGDRITMQLGVADGVLERVGFTGRGQRASRLPDRPRGRPTASTLPPPRRRQPVDHRSPPIDMPKSYTDLLREARASVPEVTVQQTDDLRRRGVTIVDVRETNEWEQGHLPGAILVGKSWIEQRIEGAVPDRETPVVLYCAGGIRSLFAGQILQQLGYTNVSS